ncbi:MAG: DegV family protein [Candidatus Heimdallarchaeum endolithica]|uniref:DegV family protein n=1 Tax=Candidatus Heimdallarchaeum endolithica TaxID=2876572 RepID=A0A9Y1FR11_9ARCH|nr:MAG: DegV family protein [Candidatus Heimdallarchaeum endolithica]
MSIRIVTDSASDIDRNFAKEKKVAVVPLSVTYNTGETFKEDENFDFDKYYNNYSDPDFSVTTSQPSPKDFLNVYEQLKKECAKEIIVITISSGLSGTLNSAQLAAKMFLKIEKDIEIYFVDSLNASIPETFLVEEGLKLIDKGLSGKEIAEKLQNSTNKITTLILLPTLYYLRKGGRISAAKYLLGRLLQLKPITIVNEEGKNEVTATVRDYDEGLVKMIEIATQNYTRTPVEVAIVHTNSMERATKLQNLIKEKLGDIKIRIVRSGVTISAHTGSKCVSLISKFFEF